MRALKLIILGLFAAPALALLALGPRPREEVPRDRVIVEYWEKWTGTEEQQMRQIVDAFNDTVGREKGIFVRYLSTSAIDKKTLVATAAGAPPDIAGLWDSNIAPYAARDALEPLDELAREAGITSGTYKRVYWDACHYDGKLYALVSTPAVVALIYNGSHSKRPRRSCGRQGSIRIARRARSRSSTRMPTCSRRKTHPAGSSAPATFRSSRGGSCRTPRCGSARTCGTRRAASCA
jgi:maltose-binding protein MalE